MLRVSDLVLFIIMSNLYKAESISNSLFTASHSHQLSETKPFKMLELYRWAACGLLVKINKKHKKQFQVSTLTLSDASRPALGHFASVSTLVPCLLCVFFLCWR